MMLDVNDFKQINDTFGHAAGDAILRELGSLLLKHVRGEDIASRYGGDEFILILPDVAQEVTTERAERLCEHVRHIHVQYAGQALEAVSLPFGVVSFPEHGSTSGALLKSAEDALYRAKRAGRGRVVVTD